MVLPCCVIGCYSKHFKNTTIKFHRYPKDKTLKKKWVDSVNGNLFNPSRYSVVCSNHFSEEDYEYNAWGIKTLKSDAIPQRKCSNSAKIPQSSTSNTSDVKSGLDNIRIEILSHSTASTLNTLAVFENIDKKIKPEKTANTSYAPVEKFELVDDQLQRLKFNKYEPSTSIAAKNMVKLAPVNPSTRVAKKIIQPIVPIPFNCHQMDAESIKGRFGWQPIASHHVPYIIRVINDKQIKFVSVRMAETQMLKIYLQHLSVAIFNMCVSVESHFITTVEAKLLNEINVIHCTYLYGAQKFIAGKDTIVLLEDAQEFYKFVELCYNKLKDLKSLGSQEKCGFIRLNVEAVLAYCAKDNKKYIPTFFFEDETNVLANHAVILDKWNFAYIKFCCMVLGIKKSILADLPGIVITFNDLKKYFVPETKYVVFWPNVIKVVSEYLIYQKYPKSGAWTKSPKVVSVLENTKSNILSAPLAHNMPMIVTTNQNILPTNQMASVNMTQGNILTNIVVHNVPPPFLIQVPRNAIVIGNTVSNPNLAQHIHNTQQHNNQPVRKIIPLEFINLPSTQLFPQTPQSSDQFVNVQSTSQQRKKLRNIKPRIKIETVETIDLVTPTNSPVRPML